MNLTTIDDRPSDDADKLAQAVDLYVRQCKQGRPPNIDEFVLQYPDFHQELRSILQMLNAMESQTALGQTATPHSGNSEWSFLLDQTQATANPAIDGSSEHPVTIECPFDYVKKIGKFALIAQVGEGGFGQVWKAWDSQLARIVALKLIRKHLSSDAAVRARFLREARAAAQLRHPNIVQAYEVFARMARTTRQSQLVKDCWLYDQI